MGEKICRKDKKYLTKEKVSYPTRDGNIIETFEGLLNVIDSIIKKREL